MDMEVLLGLLREGRSDRNIANTMKLDRRTVKKYRVFSEAEGWLSGALPELAEIHQQVKRKLHRQRGRRRELGEWETAIKELYEKGVAARIIHQRLEQEAGYELSETQVRRYVQTLKKANPQVTIRIETAPGQEAQVDFGKTVNLWDAEEQRYRTGYIFSMVLSWSRHMYVEFVHDQRVETWLACHRHSFEFFEGVPERVRLDNLKAAILKASAEKPLVQRAYAECARHYGFRIDPCKPRRPEHKGKVERAGIGYVKTSFVPLLPDHCTRAQANQRVRLWLLSTAGNRDHGTTHVPPLERFEIEQLQLLLLPSEGFEPYSWKVAKVQRDCHITFEKGFYSVPWDLVGKTVSIRIRAQQIEIFDPDWQLAATHKRVTRPGLRQTLSAHLPPDKVAGLEQSRPALRKQAQEIGPVTSQVVEQLLADQVERGRMVRNILSLRNEYSDERLEAACERALSFDDIFYSTIKRILQQGLDQSPMPQFPTPDGGRVVHARSSAEFALAFMRAADDTATGRAQ